MDRDLNKTGIKEPVIPENLKNIRDDFPLLASHPGMIYFDNAATSLKARPIIESMHHYLEEYSANVHRSFHSLGEKATLEYENARKKIVRFIHARSGKEVIYTSGTTASINLVAYAYGLNRFKPGDVILLSEMEHHSNLVPWQMIAGKTGASLRFIPFNEKGELDLSGLDQLLTPEVKFVSVVHASNVFGTINPVKTIIDKAHTLGIPVMLDAAQSAPHMKIDVQDLDCDFLAFSGHKMLGPTGIGILYGKEKILNGMEPFMGGGDMISSVWLEKAKWNDLPYKFEAGTPNISGAIGLGYAVDYLENLGMDQVESYCEDLTRYAMALLEEIPGVKVYGHAEKRTGAIAFSIEGIHPHDIAQYLSQENIAVRAGHHCAHPVMRKLGVTALARASVYFYNTPEEVRLLQVAVMNMKEYFKV
jgi:cysteine desulfurase/selenocysteine lyase